jgi:hypothetical protein
MPLPSEKTHLGAEFVAICVVDASSSANLLWARVSWLRRAGHTALPDRSFPDPIRPMLLDDVAVEPGTLVDTEHAGNADNIPDHAANNRADGAGRALALMRARAAV